MAADEAIAIGELARRTGCHIETIRYYERIGLMPKAARRGRYRSYGAADTDRLRFVCRSRELGFTIEEVRTLLGIASADEVSCAQARAVAASHLSSVRARLADLRRMERVLAATVRACDTRDHVQCPLIETLSETRSVLRRSSR